MTQAEKLVAEFDEEMKSTRRVLERVPSEDAQWKPHPKSFAMGHLAQLVARMPGWFTQMLGNDKLDMSGAPNYSFETTPTLLAEFDRNVKEARAAFTKVKDSDMDAPWSLSAGGKILMTMPREAVIRQTFSHLAHHRGQLTVYLRLRDVPVPSVYGPTADEGWGG